MQDMKSMDAGHEFCGCGQGSFCFCAFGREWSFYCPTSRGRILGCCPGKIKVHGWVGSVYLMGEGSIRVERFSEAGLHE